jgi:BlaI family penicillinase repressor
MARPTRELTDRELEVMHVFWQHGKMTAAEAPTSLPREASTSPTRPWPIDEDSVGERVLELTNDERPFRYKPMRTFADVSCNLVGDLVERVFKGSRDQLLINFFSRQRLSAKERAAIEQILKDQKR